MPQLDFYDMCPEPVAIPLPTNNYQFPCCSGGGGGEFTLFTADSDQVNLLGNGTSGSPLTAQLISGQMISFEIAVGKINGFADGDVIALYDVAKPCTIPANLVGSQFKIEDQVGDALVNLEVNGIIVGSVNFVGGIPDVTLAADINLVAGDMLVFIAGSVSTFSLLAITILGLRALDYVA
jgi:hypothetical protein